MKSGLTPLAGWPSACNTQAAHPRQSASCDCSLAATIARTFELDIAFGTFRPWRQGGAASIRESCARVDGRGAGHHRQSHGAASRHLGARVKVRRNYTPENLAALREAFIASRDPNPYQGNLL